MTTPKAVLAGFSLIAAAIIRLVSPNN